MTFVNFLTLISALTGFLGTTFMIKGVLEQTPKMIARLGQTKYGSNQDQINLLASQKADTLTGFCLIFVAFIFQIVSQVFIRKDFIFLTYEYSTFALLILGFVIFIITILFINSIYKKHQIQEINRARTRSV